MPKILKIFLFKKNFFTLIWAIFSFVLIISLFYSITNNSIKYSIYSDKNNLFISVLDQKIVIPYEDTSKIKFRFFPQQRYSTPQYFIRNQNTIGNACKIILLLFTHKNPSDIQYEQNRFERHEYIQFNPFRSTLTINDRLRLETNIPDSNLEVWDKDYKLFSLNITPPWIKLIVYPLISSFLISMFLYLNIIFFIRTKKGHNKKYKQKNMFYLYFLKFIEPLNKWLTIIIFLIGTVVIGFIFIKIFKTMPGFGDEMNYLFQAKIFSSGHIFVNEPSHPEFFRISWMDIFGNDGRLWNFHPFGNSVILTIGQLLGIRWITVPIIGGLILMTQYLLAKELFNNKVVALINVVIIITSHYFLSLASSYMAHAPSFLFISLFYLFIAKTIKRNNQAYLLPAAIFLSVAFIIRPLSAVLSSMIPLLILLTFLIKKHKELNLKIIIISITAGAIIISTIFLYSYAVAGKWTFSYLIKGPEKEQTIQLRLKRDLNYILSNLYRNTNELQNRVHSFGYLFNYLFFFIPLVVIYKDKRWKLILVGYSILLIYVIIHSWLHWYGWKWEPRMIYDISFIFFLLSAYGIMIIYELFKHSKIYKISFILILIISYIYLIKVDLPYRFTNEYLNYNFNPSGVRDTIVRKKISNAIIFFENEFVFGPYFPDNNINFDGAIIYAILKDDYNNCILIKNYPSKKVYYSPDGELLIKKNIKCS